MNASYRVCELVRQRISNEFLKASDTDVSRVLGLSRAAVSAYKHSRDVMSPHTFARAQEILRLPENEAGEIAAQLMRDAARTPGERELWSSIVQFLHSQGRHAAAIVAVVMFALLAFAPGKQAVARAVSESSDAINVYFVKLVSRIRRRVKRFRDFVGGLLHPRAMRHATWFPVAVLCSGCTALESSPEQTWLALHAIDSAQTYRVAQDPHCFREGNAVTRELIGASPTRANVIAWSLGTAALHVGISDWLLTHEHRELARIWQWITIGETAYTVGHNYYVGVRIGGTNEPRDGACAP